MDRARVWEEESLRHEAADPVASRRDRFEIPFDDDPRETLYVCGHSLGAMPRRAREQLVIEAAAWGRLGVEAHFRDEAPWFTYAEQLAESTARVIGAMPDEVVSMNSLTVNLHQLFATFFRPTAERYRILIEDGAFPSDRYAVMSQLQHHGIAIEAGLVLVKPRPGEDLLRSEDIESLIEEHRESLALVWLPGIQYTTGQVLDIERLTAAAHAAGAMSGWDLAHAAGNIPTRMHDWDADFAVWCTYKYMNAGPGSTGQAFIHERWASDPSLVRLAGWFGNDPVTRFEVTHDFVPAPGAVSWQVSNPPILALAPLRASLELFDEVGIEALRARSERLTAHLQAMLDEIEGVETVTPRDPAQRAAMFCLRVPHRSREVERALAMRGVILDFRAPDIFRVALAPLYNTYSDAAHLAGVLREVVRELTA